MPDTFWGMTWSEYNRAASGYLTRRFRAWEHTREIIVNLWNVQLQPQDRLTSKKLIRLPIDEEVEQLEEEEAKYLDQKGIEEMIQLYNRG